MRNIILLLALLLLANGIKAQIPNFKIGLAKTDITCYQPGGGMLGYGMAFNVVKGVETPLYARSFVIEDAQLQKMVVVECELCFIPSELKTAIVDLLQKDTATKMFNEQNVMILAQHTHSAPGGYCHYASYNMSVPGYIASVFDTLCTRIARSITLANTKLQPCAIGLNKGMFAGDREVAFNRSLAAYNKNNDVTPLSHENRHLAVNREMTMLHFEGIGRKPLGSVNWFGVHATSLSNDNRLINADNKGYAAAFLEEHFAPQNKDYVGAFAQGTAGDVTPKYVYNGKRKWQRGYWEGKYPDDIASAQYNGELQYKKAKELTEEVDRYWVARSSTKCVMRYFDFSAIKIDTMHSHTKDVQYTSPSCIGIAMLGGALMDGPGAPQAVLQAAKLATQTVRRIELAKAARHDNAASTAIIAKYKAQGKKDIVLETGAKKMMGTKNVKDLIIPGFTDPTVATFKRFDRAAALKENSWSPQILPVQLMEIGDIVLVAFPFEITTTAGRRLKKGVEELYKNEKVKEIILCPYANSYSGYITTPEEYEEQMYEGGHSVFGTYSLAALQTVLKQLYALKNKPMEQEEQLLRPPTFSKEELERRSFYER